MRLDEAIPLLRRFVFVPFGQILTPAELADLKTDKGIVGKLLEKAVGLSATNVTLDFDDGELKTNKCRADGAPRETIFITQISGTIDSILDEQPFEQSILCLKTRHMLIVPVVKEGATRDWRFLPFLHVDLRAAEFAEVAQQIRSDYYSIARQLRAHIEHGPDGHIHTSNGLYIQVRSKDGRPYHPIFSHRYGRFVSTKNYAFYFRKEFMRYLQARSPGYPLRPR